RGQIYSRIAFTQNLLLPLAIDGDPGNMGGDFCQPHFLRLRSAGFLAIHGERTQDIALPRNDWGRPTGAQSANLRKLTIISPERICHHVSHDYGPARVHGSATGTVAWSDRRAIYRFHISFRQIRRRAVT